MTAPLNNRTDRAKFAGRAVGGITKVYLYIGEDAREITKLSEHPVGVQ